MYPLCCANVEKCAQLADIDIAGECPDINVVPSKCKFSNNTNEIYIKMSGKAIWKSFPTSSESARGTDIFGTVLKETANEETGVLEWVGDAFAEPMTCEVDQNTK